MYGFAIARAKELFSITITNTCGAPTAGERDGPATGAGDDDGSGTGLPADAIGAVGAARVDPVVGTGAPDRAQVQSRAPRIVAAMVRASAGRRPMSRTPPYRA